MLRGIVSSGLGIALFVSPLVASADALSDLQAQFQMLLAQIAALKAQQESAISTSMCVTLSSNLSIEDTDSGTNGEVTKLQQFLAKDSSVYPEGRVTGFFGPATQRAVQRWQKARGIVSSGDPDSTGYGFVGSRTRAAMACGGATANTNSYMPPSSTATQSTLTPDQIKIISPMDTTVGVGAMVKIVYVVGSNIVPSDPAIVERSVVDANTEAMDGGYIPLSQSAGTYSFDWVPAFPGTYRALLRINHNYTTYMARSGIITAVASPINSTAHVFNGSGVQVNYGPNAAAHRAAVHVLPDSPFTISGTTSLNGPLTVALVEIKYAGSTDWNSVGNLLKDGSGFRAVSNSAPVSGGNWTSSFGGLPEGYYHFLIYDESYNLKGSGFLVTTLKG